MRYRAIIRFFGIATAVIACFFLSCVGVDFLSIESTAKNLVLEKWAWVLGETGLIMLICLMMGKKPETPLVHREAILTVGLIWLFITYLGSLPYTYVTDQSFANSLFESASGFTTTGATIFSDVESLPKSILFWRSLSSWLGGLGVVVLFVAFLSSLGVTGKALFAGESSAKPAIEDFARIQKSALKTVGIYLGLSTFFTFLLLWAGVDLFNALCHMGNALATSGFSNFNDSIGHYNAHPIVQWILIALMVIGSVNFAILSCFATGRWKTIRQNEEFWAYLAILTVTCFTVALLISLYDPLGIGRFNLRQAVLQVVSFMTSTGYTSSNYQLWPGGIQLILFVVMIIGGCSNSTAGGLKVVRLIVGGKVLVAALRRTVNPHIVRPIKLNDTVLEPSIRDSMLLYVILSLFLWSIGLTLIGILEPQLSLATNLSAFIGCWVNGGIYFGEIGPSNNFGNLHDPTKFLLIFSMLLGRLEIYALLALFLPSLWRRFG